jgi:hypothetical protein
MREFTSSYNKSAHITRLYIALEIERINKHNKNKLQTSRTAELENTERKLTKLQNVSSAHRQNNI